MHVKAPQAVQSCHNLILWMIPQIDKFPRVRRFTLGERIESSLLTVLRGLIQAYYAPRYRSKNLEQVNTELTVIRHLWRLAFKLEAIGVKNYESGSKMLMELGRQIGGWKKTASQ